MLALAAVAALAAVTQAEVSQVAIVVGDQVALRAAPQRDAPRQTILYRGDWLEVRGQKREFWKVYDHRHERPGYVAMAQVRVYPLAAESAPALRAVMGFLRDTPGQESLGIAYTALYLRAAPAPAIGSDVFDALGVMAERLARRASAAGARDGTASQHVEVAETYGVRFVSFEQGDGTRTCYDGEAFRHVLALGGTAEERARAALALTDPACLPPSLKISELEATHEQRLRVLDQAALAGVPGALADRLHLRRAQVAAALAYALARRGPAQAEAAARAGEQAIRALALVDKAELADDDGAAYGEAALQVAAVSWAVAPVVPPRAAPVSVGFRPGEPGQTCVAVADPKSAPVENCTYGQVWQASLRVAPGGVAVALAVQPLPGWLELWVFRKQGEGWRFEVLSPSTDEIEPGLGYVELAGWSPDASRLLVVREVRVDGEVRRAFQILRSDTLAVDRQAGSLTGFATFRKWAAADWKGRTLALR